MSSTDNPLYGKQPSAAKLAKLALKASKKQPCVESAVGAVVMPVADAAQENVLIKVPRGTRDTTPSLMVLRERALAILKQTFQHHGATAIDTPVFERKDTLTSKFGEDEKLIFDLSDQGGELCALRYDLTAPFARFLVAHGIERMRRYQIGRVYRRDTPATQRGRYREFYQADFDIAGVYPSMVPDSEVLAVLIEALDALELGVPYKIRIGHRKLLDGMMETCGVPRELLRPICSAIDKLDKLTWPEVRAEMVTKGLCESSADKLGELVLLRGDVSALDQIKAHPELSCNASVVQAVEELDLLDCYLSALGCDTKKLVQLDLSLARGLDYYTGLIYEAVLIPESTSTRLESVAAQLGSIAAGGRYDNLTGLFASKPVPSVGVSVGVERILTLLEAKQQDDIKTSPTQVLVASIGDGLLTRRMQMAKQLWVKGVCAEYLYDANPRVNKQLDYATKNAIPYILWLGEDELARGVATLKHLTDRSQEELPLETAASLVAERIVR